MFVAAALKIIDILANFLIPTPLITRDHDLQEENTNVCMEKIKTWKNRLTRTSVKKHKSEISSTAALPSISDMRTPAAVFIDQNPNSCKMQTCPPSNVKNRFQ
jgi:hypothetical protein